MPKVSLYLHIHQPFRLREYALEDLGNQTLYFGSGDDLNREVFEKITRKSYLPMLRLLEKLVYEVPEFRVAFSITGIWVEQASMYHPELLDNLRSIMRSGKAEIVAETYYHSLASLYSETEFAQQVWDHMAMVKEVFEYVPTSFRNTELVYSNDVARQVATLGFNGILTEGVDRILQGRPKTQLYYSVGEEQLPIMPKHAQLSDDIAFRFSDRSWQWFPLSTQRYLDWVEVYGEHELVNLFMDFETFGEHQWEDTGIFGFFETFVHEFVKKPWNSFVNPAEVFANAQFKPQAAAADSQRTTVSIVEESAGAERIVIDVQETAASETEKAREVPPPWLRYDAPWPISWADVDRDLSAWLENDFQQDCIEQMYALEGDVLASHDLVLIADWRRLQTSDHFYYMCTKWSADGDVHAYFSPYRDPFEAYRRFSVVLADIKHRLWSREQGSRSSRVLAPPRIRE